MSCGGGNDVTSSVTTAVSAAAPTPASTTTATTEPKVNGQIDEQTGVAPVAAQMTVWTVYSNGGCASSSSFANSGAGNGSGPALTQAQQYACAFALMDASNNAQCYALGGNACCSPQVCQYH